MINPGGFQKTGSLQTPPVFGEVPEAWAQPVTGDRVAGFPDLHWLFPALLSNTFACTQPSAWTSRHHHWFGLIEVCKPHRYSRDNRWIFDVWPPRWSLRRAETTCIPPWPQDGFNKCGTQKSVRTASDCPSPAHGGHMEKGW